MAITYEWGVSKLDCIPTVGDKTNVVIRVYWFCEGTETDNPDKRKIEGVYIVQPKNDVKLDTKTGKHITTSTYVSETFTDYQNLTLEQILNWCWADTVNQQAVEKSIEAWFNRANTTSSIVSPALPF